MPENPVVDVLMSRRSIRRFQDRSVSEEQVRAIVQAGQRAPRLGNSVASFGLEARRSGMSSKPSCLVFRSAGMRLLR